MRSSKVKPSRLAMDDTEDCATLLEEAHGHSGKPKKSAHVNSKTKAAGGAKPKADDKTSSRRSSRRARASRGPSVKSASETDAFSASFSSERIMTAVGGVAGLFILATGGALIESVEA